MKLSLWLLSIVSFVWLIITTPASEVALSGLFELDPTPPLGSGDLHRLLQHVAYAANSFLLSTYLGVRFG